MMKTDSSSFSYIAIQLLRMRESDVLMYTFTNIRPARARLPAYRLPWFINNSNWMIIALLNWYIIIKYKQVVYLLVGYIESLRYV